MKAFILAGGRGTRLRPLTDSLPKPLVPLANVPLARHTVALLRQQGIDDFVFLLHYLPEKFPLLLGDGSDPAAAGCRFTYVAIPQDLDTAGCVKSVEENLSQPSLVFSGDIVADFTLSDMLRQHRQQRAQITIAVRAEALPFHYGVVQFSAGGRITRFVEKPSLAEVFSNWISCGIYLLEPGALADFAAQQPLSFEREVFPFFAERRKAIAGWPLTGYWRDIGQATDYLQTHADFLAGKLPAVYRQTAQQLGSDGDGAGNFIGTQVVLRSRSQLHRCVIGKDCIIEPGAELQDAVLWDGVRVGRGAKLRACVVGTAAHIGAGAEVHGPVLLAPGREVPSAARVGPQASPSSGPPMQSAVA